MCMSSPKAPNVEPYKADPAPTPIEPTEVAAQSQEDRRKRIEKTRFGLASTIKTSPTGVGKAADLLSPQLTGKTKLGQ